MGIGDIAGKDGWVGGVGDWLGGTSMEEGLAQLGIEGRPELEEMYRRAAGMGYDPTAGLMESTERLQGIATGQQEGAGQRAARMAGQEALAALTSQAAGAQGYGGGAVAREALRSTSATSQRVAAEQAMAALRDQQMAEQGIASLLSGAAQRQMAGAGGIAGLRQAELGARTGLVTGQAGQAAPWETLAGMGLQVGGMMI